MPICPKCEGVMEPKGHIEDEHNIGGTTIIYQCSKCKNIELHWKEYNHELRTNYP